MIEIIFPMFTDQENDACLAFEDALTFSYTKKKRKIEKRWLSSPIERQSDEIDWPRRKSNPQRGNNHDALGTDKAEISMMKSISREWIADHRLSALMNAQTRMYERLTFPVQRWKSRVAVVAAIDHPHTFVHPSIIVTMFAVSRRFFDSD